MRCGIGRDGYDCMYMVGEGWGGGSIWKEIVKLFNLEVESFDYV